MGRKSHQNTSPAYSGLTQVIVITVMKENFAEPIKTINYIEIVVTFLLIHNHNYYNCRLGGDCVCWYRFLNVVDISSQTINI